MVNIQMTEKDQINVGGKLMTSGNFGSPQLILDYRRLMSPSSYMDVETRIGSGNRFKVGVFKQLAKRCSATLHGLFKYRNGSLTPVLMASVNYQLDANLVGKLEFKNEISDRENAYSSMATTLVYEKNDYHVSLRFQLSPSNPFVALMMEKSFAAYEFRLKSHINLGYMGLSLTYGVEKQVTKFSKVTASIVLNSQAGVFLNIE